MSKPALVGLAGTELGPRERELLRELRPLGVLVFRRNVRDASQLRGLCAAVRDTLGEETLIAADQEGGAVSVLREAVEVPPPALAMGMTADRGLTRDAHERLGRDALALGVNWILGPVADLVGGEHAVLATRSFGSDATQVAIQVQAAVEGLHAAGQRACVKHWPGHGRPVADSHLELPEVEASMEELLRAELVPFVAAFERDVDAVMVAHLRVPALDASGTVSSASPIIVREWLRQRLQYEGLILADAMEMAAASPAADQLAAGCDLLLFARPIEQAGEAVRELPEASAGTLDRVARARPRTQELAPEASDDPYREVRERCIEVLLPDPAQAPAWPPCPEGPIRIGLVDRASGDRLVREPDGASLEPLRPATKSILGARLGEAGFELDFLWSEGRWVGDTEVELPLVALAGLRPWPAPEREALRAWVVGRATPPLILLLGDPSPERWLGDLAPVLLCPGLESADFAALRDVLRGAIERAPRDRWGF